MGRPTLTIEHVRQSVAAASTAKDPTMRVLYLAGARAVLNELRAELAQVETNVSAIEVEVGRTSRDVTQLSPAELEAP